MTSGCGSLLFLRDTIMTSDTSLLVLATLVVAVATGCKSLDPAAKFMTEMDHAPAEKRPKDWEHTRTLMSRPGPAVGQPAPDFTLLLRGGEQTVTRSSHQAGRPQVLIFGSFT